MDKAQPEMGIHMPTRSAFIYMLYFALHKLAQHVSGEVVLRMEKYHNDTPVFTLEDLSGKRLNDRMVELWADIEDELAYRATSETPTVSLKFYYAPCKEYAEPLSPVRLVHTTFAPDDAARAQKVAYRTASFILNYLLHDIVPQEDAYDPKYADTPSRLSVDGQPIPISEFLKGPLL